MQSANIFGAPDDDASSNAGKQFDAEAKTDSPARLCLSDMRMLMKNFPLALNVAMPFGAAKGLPVIIEDKTRLRADAVIEIMLILVELPILLGLVPAFLLLPGWAFVLAFLGCYLLIWALASLAWGSLTVKSRAQIDVNQHKDEQWIFINGVATGHAKLQRSCDMLATTFKRPILGIHNRSWGVIGDLIECLIQRSFDYSTTDVRAASGCLKTYLQDDSKKKVVLIAHSQGGIITSMVLDRLYTQLAACDFGKLEVYTFGSAARTFNNPLTSMAKMSSIPNTPTSPPPPPTPPPRLTETPQFGMTRTNSRRVQIPNRLIPYVEHYCNAKDPVPRWGVLYHIIRSTPTTYSGRVFVHEKQSGHLFDNHYLGRMFPLLEIDSTDPQLFQNHVVENNNHALLLKAATFPSGDEALGANGAPADALTKRTGDADGLKVQDLSRLWKYMNGGNP